MDETAAFAALDRRLTRDTAAPVALALSGGGDSIALLRLASAWCARRGRPLLALTVDHRLNPASRGWTAFAGEAALAAGAAWRALAWTGEKPAAGLPAAARAARHRLLAQAAREAGAAVILTGHTLDDALEGERMREADAPTLGRLAEWAPSPAWPEGRDVFLLRPLLALRRAELRDWLRGQGATWIDDPANDDPRFARARARAFLRSPSPLGDKVSAESTDEGSFPPHRLVGPCASSGDAPSSGPSGATFSPRGEGEVTVDGRIVLPRHGLDGRTLAAALLCAAGTDRPPRGEALARLRDRLDREGRVDATLCGARIVADGARVQIGRDAGERFRGELGPVALRPGVPVVWDGRFEITAGVAGWTAAPLGGAMARLPPEDRRALKPVPAWARGGLPVLLDAAGQAHLPRPFGDGPAFAQSLGDARLMAACGLMAREADMRVSRHGGRGSPTLSSDPSDIGLEGAALQRAQGRR